MVLRNVAMVVLAVGAVALSGILCVVGYIWCEDRKWNKIMYGGMSKKGRGK